MTNALKWIDRIDDRGNIRAHVDAGEFRAPYYATGGGRTTLCGLRVMQWQEAAGNAKCRRCLQLASRLGWA